MPLPFWSPCAADPRARRPVGAFQPRRLAGLLVAQDDPVPHGRRAYAFLRSRVCISDSWRLPCRLSDTAVRIAHIRSSTEWSWPDLNLTLFGLSCCRFDGRQVKLIPACARTQQG